MHAVNLVVALAIAQFIFFAMLVARGRTTYRIPAPATSGHEQFERLYRVQMNTLEQLVAFLPALLLAAQYWSPALVAAVGAVYLLGFGLSHPLAKKIGAWPSVLAVTAAASGASWALSDRVEPGQAPLG